MTDSGWWPHNAADLGGYATTVLAIITVFLLVIAFRQFRLLRKQADDAAKGVAAAEAAAVAAMEASYEAAKSRADASAPRVVVEVGKPLGAYTDINRRAMPYANELRLLDQQSISRSQQIQPGLEFIFDRDRGLFLWFLLRGTVRNEGVGSARVRLDGEANFNMRPQGAEVVMKPGDELMFQWGIGLTAGEWADRVTSGQSARGFLSVTVMDYQEHGVIDHAYVEFGARPLQPTAQQQGLWAYSASDEHFGTTVYPLQRTYRWEWGKGGPKPPPWAPDD